MTAAVLRLPPGAWGRLAPGLLLLAVQLALLRETALAMVGIWNRSDTFAHAFLVPPIVIWLVWRRREHLAQLSAKPVPWVLLPIGAMCFLWLLGELASVNAASQLALVSLLVLTVPAVYGLQVARALTFPLLFSFFAVPLGEFMLPSMMQWTADFTVLALQLSGVPVLREGLQFVIPTGNWSVVEACSGVRYLIASFMVGTLFAYLNYRSSWRRAVFMVVSLLVPIVANWVRAYLIVMTGHLSGNELAVGADHLIYGWVFFGIVIGLMFMIGARWTEADLPAATGHASATGESSAARVVNARAHWQVSGLAALLVLGVQWSGHRLTEPSGGPSPRLDLPASLPGGWLPTDDPVTAWVPDFSPAAATATRTYVQGQNKVGVRVLYYRDQTDQSKLVSSINNLVGPGGRSEWAVVSTGSVGIQIAQGALSLRAARLRGGGGVAVSAIETRLRVWQVYWAGGHFTATDARAKLYQAGSRLLGRGDDGAVVFFYTPELAQGNTDEVLGPFAAEYLDNLSKQLAGVQTLRRLLGGLDAAHHPGLHY